VARSVRKAPFSRIAATRSAEPSWMDVLRPHPFYTRYSAASVAEAVCGFSFHEENLMKTMTCRELGETCGEKLSAGSWDEMVKAMTKHVIRNHPDVAKQMEKNA